MSDNAETNSTSTTQSGRLSHLTLAALGIVYGDIGTSPLYAVRECFRSDGGLDVTAASVLGVLSLIFWALVLVVSLKYLTFVMRADNDGEGGILALMTLAVPRRRQGGSAAFFTLMGLFGAGLLYGDGMITPAISVLSAIEGIHVATSALDHLVVPITLAILLGLFLVQRRGTARIGRLFGPVMLLWFAVLVLLGTFAMARNPVVLQAISPHHAVQFLAANRQAGFVILGVVFLVVTGGEALYADMGHFGARPIRLAWFALVLPSLVINYFGQGALLLADPTATRNPFYLLAPEWALYPLVLLAAAATVIASQAVISGAFSLSSQAVQLGFLPRTRIIHTSKDERGQIYVPTVNWLLFVAVIGLVLAFRTSSKLAAAYGMAVTTTMVITSILFYIVARRRWHWPWWAAGAIVGLFILIDLTFFGASLFKIPAGGWFPLLVGAAVAVTMTTWRRGQQVVADDLAGRLVTTDVLLNDIAAEPPMRVKTPAVYLTKDPRVVPLALLHNLRHNRVLHGPVGLLTIEIEEQPWVPLGGRAEVQPIGEGIYRIVAHYGFRQRPNVPNVLDQCRQYDLDLTGPDTTFFLGRVTLDVSRRLVMSRWRKYLFVWLSRNSDDASSYFGIPPEQVVEIGLRLQL
ncbi:MAG: potassium transporter Kup [Planctomycetaceae bacterium]